MVKLLIILALITISYQLSAPNVGANIKCYWVHNWTVYQLNGLETKDDAVIQNPDKTAKNSTVTYNFCKNVAKPCADSTPSQMIQNQETTCNTLAGSANNYNSWSVLNSTDPNSGLQIKYNQGGKCSGDQNFEITLNVVCDSSQDGINFTDSTEFFTSACSKTINARSKEACPKANFYVISEFLTKNSFYIGFVIIAVGLVLGILGSKLIPVTIFIGCVLAVMLIALFFVFSVFGVKVQWAVWVTLGISLVIGLILGFFMTKFRRIFFAIFGGFLGFIFAVFIYNLFLHNISGNQHVIYWVTIGVLVVLFAILAYIFFNAIIILSTSFIGSYGFIRGISMYAGGFPSEGLVLQLIEEGETKELNAIFTWRVYVYLASVLVLFGIFIFIQYKYFPPNTTEEKDKEEVDQKLNNDFYVKIGK